MEHTNPSSQPYGITSYREKRNSLLVSGQGSQRPDSDRHGPEFRTEVLTQLSEIQSNLYPRGREPENFKYESQGERTRKDETPSPLKLDKIFRRDPNFNAEAYSHGIKAIDALRDTKATSNIPQADAVSYSNSNSPLMGVPQPDNRPKYPQSGEKPVRQSSPEKELIEETRHDVEKLREDVDELKHKVAGIESRSNSRYVSPNASQMLNRADLAYQSPSRPVSGYSRHDRHTSPLAAALDENIASIKQDIANILNSAKQYGANITNPNLRTPGSASASNFAGGQPSYKSPPVQQYSSSPGQAYQPKAGYYSSILSKVSSPSAGTNLASTISPPQRDTGTSKLVDRTVGTPQVSAYDEPKGTQPPDSNKQTNPQVSNLEDQQVVGKEQPPDLSKNINRARSQSASKGPTISTTNLNQTPKQEPIQPTQQQTPSPLSQPQQNRLEKRRSTEEHPFSNTPDYREGHSPTKPGQIKSQTPNQNSTKKQLSPRISSDEQNNLGQQPQSNSQAFDSSKPTPKEEFYSFRKTNNSPRGHENDQPRGGYSISNEPTYEKDLRGQQKRGASPPHSQELPTNSQFLVGPGNYMPSSFTSLPQTQPGTQFGVPSGTQLGAPLGGQLGTPWDYMNQLNKGQPNQMQQDELKNYMQFMMNFYEFHLSNMKNIIVNQNETLSEQAKRIYAYADNESQFRSKITTLEGILQEQYLEHEKRYHELHTKYEKNMNELIGFKRSMDQISKDIEDERRSHAAAETSAVLVNELGHIKRDLEAHKDLIRELANAKLKLEHQIKELELAYHEDVKLNSFVTAKQEQLKQALLGYKEDYMKLDMMNRDMVQGYEKTRRDLDVLQHGHSSDHRLDNLAREIKDLQQSLSSSNPHTASIQNYCELCIKERLEFNTRSQPIQEARRHDEEDLAEERRRLLERNIQIHAPTNESFQREMPRRNRYDEDHVKDILKWQVSKPGHRHAIESYDRPTEYATNYKNHSPPRENYDEASTYRGNRFNELRRSPKDSFLDQGKYGSLDLKESDLRSQYQSNKEITAKDIKEMQRRRSPEILGNKSGSKQQQPKSHMTFPSQQRYEDRRDEIEKLQQKLTELGSQKQIVESQLLKMPQNGRTLAEKKRKANLERDLESIELTIDDIRQHLKKLDSLIMN